MSTYLLPVLLFRLLPSSFDSSSFIHHFFMPTSVLTFLPLFLLPGWVPIIISPSTKITLMIKTFTVIVNCNITITSSDFYKLNIRFCAIPNWIKERLKLYISIIKFIIIYHGVRRPALTHPHIFFSKRNCTIHVYHFNKLYLC